jgi:hypothetical protein
MSEWNYEDHREGGKVRRGDALYLERYVPGTHHASCWESPESFAKYIESLNKSNAWHPSGWEEGDDFSGSRSMGQTIEQCRYGWPEGAEAAAKIRDRVLAENPVRKEPVKYGIAGSFPNVPRAIAGDPMNMRVMDATKTKKKPVITLVSNMSCPWYVSAKTISNRAASVAAVVDQIEAAGYCCEVVAVATTCSGYGGDKGFISTVSVLVKPSHQPVDIGRLAFGLGNSGMFRRMVFADWGSERTCEKLGHCLGHVYELQPSEDFRDKNIYFLPQMSQSDMFETPEKCATEGVAYLLDSLAEQGCPAFKTRVVVKKEDGPKKKVRWPG